MAWLFLRNNNKLPIDQRSLEEGWIAILPDYQPKCLSNREEPPLGQKIKEEVKRYLPKEGYIITQETKLSIFRDVFTYLSPRWIARIKTVVPRGEYSWYPETNAKNILGGMIDIANCTCPNNLTVMGMVQCIKAVYISLINSLPGNLTDNQKEDILEIIIISIPYLIDIWMKLAKD